MHPTVVPPPNDIPPPGVHVPGPTFRPFLVSLGLGLLFAGLVFGGWLLVIGIVFTIATSLGWLNDARKEYRKVVEADQTGHIENLPSPSWPKRLLWSMVILLVVAVVLDQGWLPPRSATRRRAGRFAAVLPDPPRRAARPTAITVVAQNVAFNVTTINAPAEVPFTDHPGQPGRRNAPRRRHPRRERRKGLRRQGLPRRRDRDVRRSAA